jgi:hypothetical protein
MGAEVTTDIPACWFRFGYRIKADSTKIGEKAPIRSKLTNGQVIAKPGIGSCPAFPRRADRQSEPSGELRFDYSKLATTLG